MDENKLKAIVEEVVHNAVDPIKQQLSNPETGLATINRRLENIENQLSDPEDGLGAIKKKLDSVWEQTESLTEDMFEVKETLDSHSSVLKKVATYLGHNTENTGKLNKRVKTLEEKAGIVPPPELTLAEVS